MRYINIWYVFDAYTYNIKIINVFDIQIMRIHVYLNFCFPNVYIYLLHVFWIASNISLKIKVLEWIMY